METLEGFALLLVDDHPLFRDGLVAALRHRVPLLRVQAVGSIDEALQVLGGMKEGFDLVLVDYRLPGANGLRAAVQIMREHPGMGVGLMSGMEDPGLPARAREAGLMAYLPKTLEIEALVGKLVQLSRGEPVFAQTEGPAGLDISPGSPLGLTARQMDVLRALATGSSNKEIARAIGISPATVKNHVEAIFARLGATNRLQAVTMAQAVLGGQAL